MGEARQVLIVVLIGRGPPPCVLVIRVEVASHHVEGNDRHQAVGQYCPGVAYREIGRTDERIDIFRQLLRHRVEAQQAHGDCCHPFSSVSHSFVLFLFEAKGTCFS